MLCFKHMNDTIYGFLKNAKLFEKKENPRFIKGKNGACLKVDF